jgi:hypothetical protein
MKTTLTIAFGSLLTMLSLSSTLSFAEVPEKFVCEDVIEQKFQKMRKTSSRLEDATYYTMFTLVGPIASQTAIHSLDLKWDRLILLQNALKVAHLDHDEWVELKITQKEKSIKERAALNFNEMNLKRENVGLKKLRIEEFEYEFPKLSFKGVEEDLREYFKKSCDDICRLQNELSKIAKVNIDYNKLKDYLVERRNDDQLCPRGVVISTSKRSLKDLVNLIQIHH